METPEEFVGSNDQTHMVSTKRRRNKRMRLVCGGADATSSSSYGGGGDELAASSSFSGEISTEEEEDMANCLILLAQGDRHRPSSQILQQGLKIEALSTKTFNFEISKTAFYVYDCKTCNRTFPSFQALGGHRASHKKPKPIAAAAPASPVQEPEEAQFNKAVPVQVSTKSGTQNFQTHKSGKIHECSICGLEFSSGQALGGHMRRHRATAVPSTHVGATNMEHNHNHNHHNSSSSVGEVKMKQRNNILELDLNLPAPEEDLRETKFQFTPTPQTIVFSAPTLVDCHY